MSNLLRNWAKGVRVNSSRVYLERFVAAAGQLLHPDGYILDAGAGDSKYRRFFDHAHYESADFRRMDSMHYVDVTYECDLTSIPVEDARFDMVICTQVIEHVPDPTAVLTELHRVLKPGGMLYLTTPLFFAEHHAPFDFYRYTQFGLRHLAERAGFAVQRVEWLEGYYGTLSYQLERAAVELPLNPSRYGGGIWSVFIFLLALVLKPLFFALSLLFARLDITARNTVNGMCKNYALVARKPIVDA